MTLSTHVSVRCAVSVAVVAFLSGGAHAASEIGKASAITTSVTATRDDGETTLKTGDQVFAGQTVSTDANGVGQFEFRDKTKLAIGPGSTIVLDDFIYDSKGSGSKVVLDLTRGTFRFITGRSRHDAYEIRTPTATIGVRGTAFDLYVGDTGEVAVAMIDGAIEVCPVSAACRMHDVIGRFLHMTRDGLFSLHDTWDGSFFGGTSLAAALPFIANQRLLAPTLRGQTKIVSGYLGGAVGGAASTVQKTVKALPTPKLPKLKLPNPFR